MSFNVEKVTADIINWIRDWFEINGNGCNAVIGISGGKDSSVTAALCVAALGKERVVGVMMPNGVQPDIDVSHAVIEHLGIRGITVNIKDAYDAISREVADGLGTELSRQTVINIAPRIRMTALYAASQSLNGRVANTCNLSEDWVGYSTRWGDSVGDFSPLAKLTVHEVIAVGRYLGLPSFIVDKVPSDGLTGLSDEDNLGFTYETLDRYIRTGVCIPEEKKEIIDRKHKLNLFKLSMMPAFPYEPEEEDPYKAYED
ncbi:MAG: NAD(+) synthase [Clostridiales bacterium]|nr:NAD(+) synthase [Clostridiales bacterium]